MKKSEQSESNFTLLKSYGSLGKSIEVAIAKWYDNNPQLDIRSWYSTKDDSTKKPGKGIGIPLDKIEDLITILQKIQTDINNNSTQIKEE